MSYSKNLSPKEIAERSHQNMESLLTCPICLDIFSKPVVILPCQHNLCRNCADECFEQRGTRFGISGGRFKCPTCRYEVILDRHGTSGLPRNLLVENILDMMGEEKLKVERQVETQLMEEKRKMAKEKREEERLKKEKENNCCPDHNEKLNVFCMSCQKLVCATCKVFGMCQTCSVAKIDVAFEAQKTELNEAIDLIRCSSDRVHNAIAHCNDLQKRIDEVDSQSRQKVVEQFDKMFQALESKKKHLLTKINNVTKDSTKLLSNQKLKYSTAIKESTKDISAAQKLVKTNDQILFLKTSRDLIDNMLKHTSTLESRPPPVNVPNANKWRIDLNPLVEVAKKVDFSSEIRFKQRNEPSMTGSMITGRIEEITNNNVSPPRTTGLSRKPSENQLIRTVASMININDACNGNDDGLRLAFEASNPPLEKSSGKRNDHAASSALDRLQNFQKAMAQNDGQSRSKSRRTSNAATYQNSMEHSRSGAEFMESLDD